jgi:hypothetical protein
MKEAAERVKVRRCAMVKIFLTGVSNGEDPQAQAFNFCTNGQGSLFLRFIYEIHVTYTS